MSPRGVRLGSGLKCPGSIYPRQDLLQLCKELLPPGPWRTVNAAATALANARAAARSMAIPIPSARDSLTTASASCRSAPSPVVLAAAGCLRPHFGWSLRLGSSPTFALGHPKLLSLVPAQHRAATT